MLWVVLSACTLAFQWRKWRGTRFIPHLALICECSKCSLFAEYGLCVWVNYKQAPFGGKFIGNLFQSVMRVFWSIWIRKPQYNVIRRCCAGMLISPLVYGTSHVIYHNLRYHSKTRLHIFITCFFWYAHCSMFSFAHGWRLVLCFCLGIFDIRGWCLYVNLSDMLTICVFAVTQWSFGRTEHINRCVCVCLVF